eukprot:4081675-Pyramimonas_sp.AAC.1
MSKEQTKFFEDMDILNKFLKVHDIQNKDKELCSHLRMFYRYAHSFSAQTNSLSIILSSISPVLKGRLAYQ